jgi:hypothetical protein
MRRMKRKKLGPKVSSQTEHALRMHLNYPHYDVLQAAAMAGVHPSTLYRALQRRKEKR